MPAPQAPERGCSGPASMEVPQTTAAEPQVQVNVG